MKNSRIIILIFTFFCVVGCYKDSTVAGNCGVTISYSEDIIPIIQNSCKTSGGVFGCHADYIDNYSWLKARLKNGIIQNRVFDLKDMPQVPNTFGIDSLNAVDFELMKCWVEQGYRNN